VTTLNEVYAFAPGVQLSWPTSTSALGCLAESDLTTWQADVAAWGILVAAPDFNPPVTAAWSVARDFSPLVELVTEARRCAGGWAADTEESQLEQQENTALFGPSQLEVIFGQDH
jgi:hypothetical protein